MTTLPPERPRSRYAWPPLPVPDVDQASEIMGTAMQAAWDDLEAERLRVLNSLTMGRKALVDAWLREYQAAIVGFRSDVDHHVERFLTLHLGPRYQAGAESVSGAMSWTEAHTVALTSLSIDTYDDFLQRAREAERVSESFVRAVRDASKVELPKIAAGGRTAIQAADRLEERLLTQYGITHVTYRDGSHVPVRQYARMAARTKSAVAYNAGTLNEVHAVGGSWVEVFDGADCGWTGHQDLDKANGTIRHIEDAAAWPIAHPNCTRGFGARLDVRTKQDAKKAAASTTAEQRADQATVDYRADRPNTRTRAATQRRARTTAQRQARQLGVPGQPEQVGDIIARTILDEASLQAARGVLGRAAAVEPRITADISSLVEDAGGTMEGLDFRLKGEGSLRDKIRSLAGDYGGDVEAAANGISDAVRYTGMFDDAEYADRARSVLADLRDQGYQLRVKNYWGHASNPYRGVNVAGHTPDGQAFELQFHTRTSLDVKQGEMHRLYEEYRYETDPAVRARLEEAMWQQTELIPTPPNVGTIE